jgi:7-cyano-7-deazaguanine synthase
MSTPTGPCVLFTARWYADRMNAQRHRAVVLCSGGIDSTTALAIAHSEQFELYCLSFSYGQRHVVELQAATQVAKTFNAHEHLVLDIALDRIGASALTTSIPVPRRTNAADVTDDIPTTYVPARNTIFLSYALALAEARECSAIFIGVTAVDYSGYPDCRPEYIEAFQRMADLATRTGVEGRSIKIKTPLISLTKAEIIATGIKLGVDYSITHSCYDPSPDGAACGTCDSCLLRRKGFIAAGVPDPTRYAHPLQSKT